MSQRTKKQRREAARQKRIEEQQRRLRAKRRKRALSGAVAVLVVLGVVAFAVARFREGRIAARATEKAGCSAIEKQKDGGAKHIQPGAKPTYPSKPPTSGDHFAAAPPPPEFREEPLDPETYVHNLEHGQVVIHYKNSLPEKQLDELEKIQSDHPDSLMVLPNDSIDKPLAITAWRYLQTCDTISEPVIETFISDRCNKSPERFTQNC